MLRRVPGMMRQSKWRVHSLGSEHCQLQTIVSGGWVAHRAVGVAVGACGRGASTTMVEGQTTQVDNPHLALREGVVASVGR